MKIFSLPARAYSQLQRVYHSFKIDNYVQASRELMRKGDFSQALELLVKAQKYKVGFSPRDALLLSYCLFSLGKNLPAHKIAVAVEESIHRDSRRYNEHEVEYLIAYSRFIRNTCAARQPDIGLSSASIDMSGIDLKKVSDDLLATFPLVQHPKWDEFGWSE